MIESELVGSAILTLQYETFTPLVGQAFALREEESSDKLTELKLVECVKRSQDPDRPRPFAVLFSGPAEPKLSQQIWWLENDAIGLQPIFLVPVAESPTERTYEAVFN